MYKNCKVLVGLILLSLISFSNMVYASDKGTVLITGANRGVGLAMVKKFNAEGYTVIATARKPGKALALKEMGVRIEALDVTSGDSVSQLKVALGSERIDILINNAGISGHATPSFSDLNVDELAKVFNVNSLGMLRVTQALLPNMEGGNTKVIANISSLMGSIAGNQRGCCYGYRASKTAMNSFNKSLAIEYGPKDYIFVVLHPGWVRTDMGTKMATYSPKESAEGLFKVIVGLKAADNGLFYDLHGKALTW
ncbi:MAG: NAD(P)-dependent dehydrogenase (short-subunit alcohol dehydrogenase family) [Oceanicoccus sp.]|jgi:NAD(P)-dependent dehydrogenase (short-subunit alcohol dehydrogenase family)